MQTFKAVILHTSFQHQTYFIPHIAHFITMVVWFTPLKLLTLSKSQHSIMSSLNHFSHSLLWFCDPPIEAWCPFQVPHTLTHRDGHECHCLLLYAPPVTSSKVAQLLLKSQKIYTTSVTAPPALAALSSGAMWSHWGEHKHSDIMGSRAQWCDYLYVMCLKGPVLWKYL